MSTAVHVPESAPGPADALRLLPIAADLLPGEIVAGRHARRVRRLVLTSLVVVLVLMLGWFGVATFQTAAARQDLETAQNIVHKLVLQKGDYADLVKIQEESRSINAQLAALLTNDLPWSTLLGSVQEATPDGVRLSRISGVLDSGPAVETDTNSARLPNTSGQKLIGRLSVSGVGSSKRAVAAYVDALGRIKGLANPLLSDASLQKSGLEFTVQVDITSVILGGRYTPAKPAEPKGR